MPCNVEAPTPFFMSLTKKLVLAFLLVTMVPLAAIIGVLQLHVRESCRRSGRRTA